MDWRHPNPTPLFSIEKMPQTNRKRDNRRFARIIHIPPLYGLCPRDFERDHQPWSCPSGTEYQYAYCSNYTGLLPAASYQWSSFQTDALPKRSDDYKLFEVTPLPLLDKHYRGANYLPDDPLGLQVPEELSRCRELMDGSFANISHNQHIKNPYTPNYRYKDWITRPLTETTREMDANYTLYCHLPPKPTEYWDFYNEVRMGRPCKPSDTSLIYRPCHVIPVPANKVIPNLPATCDVTHFGKLSRYKMEDIAPYGGFTTLAY